MGPHGRTAHRFRPPHGAGRIDVLVAQALGLTLDQLIDIYRIYFPVLQQNEAGTWYDRNGRIAWTCSKGPTRRRLSGRREEPKPAGAGSRSSSRPKSSAM